MKRISRLSNPNRYVYKCVVDDGRAPCIDGGLLTLTICKPNIRRAAKKGELIFAFGSNNESPANRLVYAHRAVRHRRQAGLHPHQLSRHLTHSVF
jgi:hypothetical protein